MAAVRAPVLRHLLSCQTRTLRASNQRRCAQVHDVRFLATTQQPRSVIEKYRAKLDQKAREEGHADIDSLKAAYADKIETLRKEADIATTIPPPPLPSAKLQQQQQQQQQPTPPPSPTTSTPQARTSPDETSSSSPTGIKPLSSILDLPKARTLPLRELTAIWRLHHASRANSLCAVIPGSTFAAMDSAARSISAQFVLPVPVRQAELPPDAAAGLENGEGGNGNGNGSAAELHFCQWTWDAPTRTATVLFTQLAEYKARGEFAAPHTTVTHYTDLQDHQPPNADGSAGAGAGSGVVLMQGQVMEDRGVSVEDARWLVMCLQRFYGGWDGVGDRARADERRRLLEWFGRGDARFSVERLLEEAERMG